MPGPDDFSRYRAKGLARVFAHSSVHRLGPGRNNKFLVAVGYRPPLSSSCRRKVRHAKEVQMAIEEAIKVKFTAQLRKSPAKGGWSYVIWP